MPNKKAIHRYVILDRLLSSSRSYSYFELLNDLNREIETQYSSDRIIQMRQFKDDLEYMKDNFGLLFDNDLINKKPSILKKIDNSNIFSLSNLPSREVIDKLKQIKLLLNQFTGSHLISNLEEFLSQVDDTIDKSEGNSTNVSFYNSLYSVGSSFLNPILNSIRNKQVLKIFYSTLSKKNKVYVISPHHLKQSRKGNWHLFGKLMTGGKPINLNLNFINHYETVVNLAYQESSIDYNEYFEDVIDVSVPYRGNVEEIIIAVKNKYIKYIDSNPIHSSQSKLSNRSDLIFDKKKYSLRKFKIIITEELVKYLLGLGNDIIVLQPSSLSIKIKNATRETYINYLSN